MDAEGLSSSAVRWTVVNEECFVRGGLLATQHQVENVGRRFHHTAFVAEVEVVEIVVDGVMATIKGWRAGPLHHVGIRVRQQTDLIALLAQLEQHVKIALGHGLHITVPSVETIVRSQLVPYNLAQRYTEIVCSNPTTFEVTKDAVLVESVQVLTCIT